VGLEKKKTTSEEKKVTEKGIISEVEEGKILKGAMGRKKKENIQKESHIKKS